MPLGRRKKVGLDPKRTSLSRKALLSLRPRRREEVDWNYYEEEGKTIITYEHEPRGVASRAWALITARPKKRKLQLDEKGSFVWVRLNGKSRLRDLIGEFSAEFHVEKRGSELSILKFLGMLDARGLIEVEVPRHEQEKREG